MFLFPEHHGVTEHKRSGADGELPDHLARHVFIVDFEDIIEVGRKLLLTSRMTAISADNQKRVVPK